MNTWRKVLNLFYYNFFRFECFAQSMIAYPIYRPIELSGLLKLFRATRGAERWGKGLVSTLNDPKRGISIYIAGLQITLQLMVFLLSVWNIVCSLMSVSLKSGWPYGAAAAILGALLLSNLVAPHDPKKYISDFKHFEAMPQAKKVRSALVTIIVVLGNLSFLIISSYYYLNSE